MGNNSKEDQDPYQLSSPYGIRFFKIDLEFMKRRGYNVTEFTRWVIRDHLSHIGAKYSTNNIISEGEPKERKKRPSARFFDLKRRSRGSSQGSMTKEPHEAPRLEPRGPYEFARADEFSESITYLI